MVQSDDTSVSSEEWGPTVGWGSSTHGSGNKVVTTSRSKGVASESAWVKRTYCMVNEGNQTQPNVISWSADGGVFEIKDIDALKKDLFPKYHGETKFESFTRRLRRYGFHREKTEPLVKTTEAGRVGTVVLAFRHENFHRDRPDLLANLNIIAPHLNESLKPSEETQTLAGSLERIEKTQEDLKRTLRQFEIGRLEQKNEIDRLRQEFTSKDDTIKSLEFRLERLENSILMAMAPVNRPLVPRFSAANFLGGPLRTQSIAETQLSFNSSHSLKDPSLTLEREMSAVGLLPFLDDRNDARQSYNDEEPTLPRSKKMKLFHNGGNTLDLDEIAMSRQTTPLFWKLPFL